MRGRAHIGFDLKNLEAFRKKLEAGGITLDRPYTRLPSSTAAIAFLTDSRSAREGRAASAGLEAAMMVAPSPG